MSCLICIRATPLKEKFMSSKAVLLDTQREWALGKPCEVDSRGYMSSVAENLYQPLSPRATDGFSKGSGSELLDTPLRPAKMKALHSSAALAVNFFDYWTDRSPDLLLTALGLEIAPTSIEFEAQFPTGLEGNPPNLDIAFRFGSGLVVGVESKFSEWLTPKSPNKELFKPKYFDGPAGLWSTKGLPACQHLAEELHSGRIQFRYLDAPQLLKHALGLATQHPGSFELYYLFFDCPGLESEVHCSEVRRFTALVGSDFHFHWNNYQEVLKQLWDSDDASNTSYLAYHAERYFSEKLST
jgi:hypothetical protein